MGNVLIGESCCKGFINEKSRRQVVQMMLQKEQRDLTYQLNLNKNIKQFSIQKINYAQETYYSSQIAQRDKEIANKDLLVYLEQPRQSIKQPIFSTIDQLDIGGYQYRQNRKTRKVSLEILNPLFVSDNHQDEKIQNNRKTRLKKQDNGHSDQKRKAAQKGWKFIQQTYENGRVIEDRYSLVIRQEKNKSNQFSQETQTQALSQIPKILSEFPGLVSLDLWFNQIYKVQNLQLLCHLKELNLGCNYIKIIEGLENLTRLQKLDLSRNQIQIIQNLQTLELLQELCLQSNRIKKLQNLEKLTSLQILWIYDNRIQRIEHIDQLESLKFINMINNKRKYSQVPLDAEQKELIEFFQQLDIKIYF